MPDGLRKPAEAMASTLFAKKLDVFVKKTKFPKVPKDTQSEEDWVRKQSAPNYGIRTLSQIKLGNKVLLIHDTEAIADKILGLEVGAFRPGSF